MGETYDAPGRGVPRGKSEDAEKIRRLLSGAAEAQQKVKISAALPFLDRPGLFFLRIRASLHPAGSFVLKLFQVTFPVFLRRNRLH